MIYLSLVKIFVWTLSLAHCARAITYYVDQSCTAQQGWNPAIITEAVDMANQAVTRNTARDNDPAMKSAFKELFKVDQDDPKLFLQPNGFPPATGQPVLNPNGLSAFDKVNCVFSYIGSLTPSANNDRDSADLRIYCDEDATGPGHRWQRVPDAVYPGNSGRTIGVDALVYDTQNYIYRALGTQGCADAGTEAETYNGAIRNLASYPNAPANLPQHRTAITLCNILFDTTQYPNKVFADLGANFDFGARKMTSDVYNSILSAILLHELTHISPLCTCDSKGAKTRGGSYRWTNCMNMAVADAFGNDVDKFGNAETFMFFGILALLESLKWKLSLTQTQARVGALLHDLNLPRLVRKGLQFARRHARDIGSVVRQAMVDFASKRL